MAIVPPPPDPPTPAEQSAIDRMLARGLKPKAKDAQQATTGSAEPAPPNASGVFVKKTT